MVTMHTISKYTWGPNCKVHCKEVYIIPAVGVRVYFVLPFKQSCVIMMHFNTGTKGPCNTCES